jgi:hypothetical protein
MEKVVIMLGTADFAGGAAVLRNGVQEFSGTGCGRKVLV